MYLARINDVSTGINYISARINDVSGICLRFTMYLTRINDVSARINDISARINDVSVWIYDVFC